MIRYNNLFGMHKIFDATYKKLTKDNYDALFLIVGDEGKSKSNLGLHMTDYWYSLIDGKCSAEKINYVSLDRSDFLTSLRDSKKFDLINYDEAGDISKKRAMSKWNVMLSQAYMVIRGLNMLTLLIIPDLFDLESFFTKRRAKGLFYVYARGKYAFYTRDQIRRIIAVNQNSIIKKISRVQPLFTGTFPKYNGILMPEYVKKKNAKMSQITENLFNEMSNDKQHSQTQNVDSVPFDEMCYILNKKMGLSTREIADNFTDKSYRTVNRRVNDFESSL